MDSRVRRAYVRASLRPLHSRDHQVLCGGYRADEGTEPVDRQRKGRTRPHFTAGASSRSEITTEDLQISLLPW